MKAAGIAPASPIPQTEMQDGTCVDCPPPCLHPACTDFALRERVVCWQGLSTDATQKIMEISRGQRDF
jgi:hypothetical protein